MKFIQKTSLKDHIEKKHKTVSNMEHDGLLDLQDITLSQGDLCLDEIAVQEVPLEDTG